MPLCGVSLSLSAAFVDEIRSILRAMANEQVLRDRLVSAIDPRWNGGLCVLFGGPGMGKSTLIRQAMLESGTLERGEQHLIRCRPAWTAAALHRAIADAINLSDDAPLGGQPDDLAGAVAEALWSSAPTRVGIVLDDLHAIDEGALDYVVALSRLLPANGHLLIASRDHPRIVATLMSENPDLVIEETSLLFTDDEVVRLAEAVGLEKAALDSAGGWPAVLALTVSAGPDVAGAYLYQTVLAGLSRRQQGDLAVAAVLGELDREVAGIVLEGPVAELGGVPLVDLPVGGGVIVHDLWNEPLHGLVSQERLEEAAAVSSAAALRNGDIERGVSVLMSVGLVADARHRAIQHIAEAADRVPLVRIDRWLQLFVTPTQALLRQTLQFIRSGLVEGHLRRDRLDDLIERVRAAGELDLEALLCEVRFAIAWSADDVNQCMDLANRMVELHSGGVDITAHAHYTAKITAARAAGQNDEALDLIRQARLELGASSGLDWWNIPLELEILLALGRPFDALEILEEHSNRLSAANVRSVTYGLTFWFTGDAERAIAALDLLLVAAGRFHGVERSWITTAELFRRWRGIPMESPVLAPDDPNETLSNYSRVCEGLCEVASLIDDGDEATATARINDLAERLPPTDGITMNAWFMGGAAWYVLREVDRPLLDGFMTFDLMAQANSVFRALLESREVGVLSRVDRAMWLSPEQVGTVLPLRWAVEFALRLPDAGREFRDETLASLELGGSRMLKDFASGDDPLLAERASAVLAERPPDPTAAIRVSLLGDARLELPELDEPSDWRRGRVRALLGLLVTRGRVTREVAIDVLWPQLDLAAGRRNLRVTLSYLIRTLEPERPKQTPSWFIQADQHVISLRTQGIEVDLWALKDALVEAKQHQDEGLASKSIEALRLACEAYEGPFLAGLDDEWIYDENNVLAREVVAACLRLSALLIAGGSPEGAKWARRAIEIDEHSIEAHEALIEALPDEFSPERQAAQARLDLLLT